MSDILSIQELSSRSVWHLVFEYLAFFVGFQVYLIERKNSNDNISTSNRWSIILGAMIGALLGSRVMAILENPVDILSVNFVYLFVGVKTIMGGLFGGLLVVEISKKIIGEKSSTGDLFTNSLITGITIGRIGCFIAGTEEFTYGITTNFILGLDLGDGVMRHPLCLYEILFLSLLFIVLRRNNVPIQSLGNGMKFKLFMLAYFGFRFWIEFLKPNQFFVMGLSSIQWLCLLCWFYYIRTIIKLSQFAYQRLRLL